MAATEKLSRLRRALLSWYRVNKRPFPWRSTRDPYRILVSEIMLQQTQADRVASLYPAFVSRYPTVERLGDASRAEVVRSWKGLGYNNRAVRLHAAVNEIRASYGGKVPSDVARLDSLPGVGKYTSHAVACFAYGRRMPVVDVNIRRVLSRIFRRMTSPGDLVDEAAAWKTAARILPADGYTWNQALMELGALVCTARGPRCGACPVSAFCASAPGLRKRRAAAKSAATGKPAAGTASEPSIFGVPRRIWRGRIVEILRVNGRPTTIGRLSLALRPGEPDGSSRWLEGVLERLEKDGLVRIRRRGSRVSVELER